MKKLVLLFLILKMSPIQGQTWQWAKSADGTGWDEGWAITADSTGNVLATGKFMSPYITFGTYTLTNSGFANVFLTKFDSLGNVLWAKSSTGTGQYSGNSLSLDGKGNTFVTGFFDTTITFDTHPLNGSGFNFKVFVTKFDSSGNALWAKSAIGANNQVGNSVSADRTGNVFVTGYFASPTLTFGTYTLTKSGIGNNVFIAKYDASGNLLWAKNTEGTGYCVSTDTAGNAYVTGTFNAPSVTFGSFILTNTNSSSSINSNVFIVKYDSNGNVLWAKNAGGPSYNYDYASTVSTDATGNVFLAGSFNSPSITFDNHTLNNYGTKSNIFIVKYDGNGNVLWANRAGGIGAGGNFGDVGFSLSTDVTGNVYLTGGFYSSPINFDTYTLNPPAGYDDPMFIVKYDANGNTLCAAALASGGDDQCGVCADRFGNAYIAGDFTVNPFIVGSTTLTLTTTTGGENAFFAKFNCNFSNEINVHSNQRDINIYPNPISDQFLIDANTTSKLTVELYDVNGRQVFSKIVSDKSNISVVDLDNGIYILSIKTIDHMINKKLAILH